MDKYKYSNSNTSTMLSTEYLFVQYVMCILNEGDKDMVMNLTYDDAIGLIARAGLEVTEFDEDLIDACCEDDY